MNETIQVLCNRRSCKKYNDNKVPQHLLNEILKCGSYAANGMGKQSAVIVVVEDSNVIKELEKINAHIMGNEQLKPFYNAKTLLIVFADKKIPTYLYDGSLVMGNLMNAAFALGVDSCWIHRAKETFETDVGRQYMKKWGLDSQYEGIANCILGYRDGALPEAKPRKENYIIFDKK